MVHMQQAAQALNQREAELRDSARQLETQRGALDDADRVITKRRIESAAYQRQLSSRQAEATMTSLMAQPPPPPGETTPIGLPRILYIVINILSAYVHLDPS